MSLIGSVGLDVAILPIGDNYTMGPEDALKAVQLLKPKVVIPCHYNTWPVIEADPHAWAKLVEKETDAKPVVLSVDETFTL
jgi:L-ascorbate metabolism protein UlaG (beta-lactamase superfamily)